MHKKIRILINSFLIGVGVGNLIAPIFYLVNQLQQLSISALISVTLLSGLIGVVSSLLFGFYDVSLKVSLPLHFLAISGIVLLMNIYNGWFDLVNLPYLGLFLLQFVCIYLLVWLVIIYMNRQKVSKINEKLRERKNSLDKGQ